MPIFTSPSKRYSGTVTLPEYYDWGQIMAYEAGLERARAEQGDTLKMLSLQAEVILPMVEAWNIQGLPEHPKSLPGTPLTAATMLHGWLLRCIGEVMRAGDDELPFSGGASGDG